MRITLITALFIMCFTVSNAQIMLKTEYLGRSEYKVNEHTIDEPKVGVQKGSAIVYSGNLNLQLSAKLNANNQPTVWGLSGGASYTRLNNGSISKILSLSDISNLTIGVYNLRPLNDKWSLLASIGAGIYAPTVRPSEIQFSNVIANFGAIFIRRIKPNLELGGGLALNNSFGYPMIFPAIYFNWTTQDKISFKVSMMSGIEMSAGYKVNDNLDLALVTEITGQGAFVKVDEKSKIVSHQYLVVGLRPEFKIGKRFSVPITAGINAGRTLEYSNRSLKSIFSEAKGYNFNISPYLAAGLVMNIN